MRSSATIHARRNENAAWVCEFYARANICRKKSQFRPVRGVQEAVFPEVPEEVDVVQMKQKGKGWVLKRCGGF